MESTETRPHLIRRRLGAALAALALAVFGAGFTACGGDDNAADDAVDTVENVGEDAGETAEDVGKDVGEKAEDVGEDAKNKAQDVEGEAEKEIGY